MKIEGFVILRRGRLSFGENMMGDELYTEFMRTQTASEIMAEGRRACRIVPATLIIEDPPKKGKRAQ